MLFTSTDDVAAESNSIGRGAEAETTAVAGKVGVRVAGGEINGITVRIEREAVRKFGLRVEVRFREHAVAARENHRARRDAEFGRPAAIVAEEPAAEVDVEGVRIEQLYPVHLRRRYRVGEDFVDEHGRDRGLGIVGAGRTAGGAAGPPLRAVI